MSFLGSKLTILNVKVFEKIIFIFIGKNTFTSLQCHEENAEPLPCTAHTFFDFVFYFFFQTRGNSTKCVENKTVEHSQK